ncbi:MAG: hypothetical protein JXE07_02860 [Candidatus Aminicenantes bacterium]|nr:hypothetical protein [Candidatus Aminicenantes bacterium]
MSAETLFHYPGGIRLFERAAADQDQFPHAPILIQSVKKRNALKHKGYAFIKTTGLVLRAADASPVEALRRE